MRQYHDLIREILSKGTEKKDRTGTGTYSIFGYQMRFDLEEGFPLVTTKKIHWKSVVHELLWFISGSTNIRYLQDNDVSIWDEWADENGNLGPVYGAQWRKWKHEGHGNRIEIDQLANVIRDLKNNPDSRRHIVSAWNVGDVNQMVLPPCHTFFQFYVANEKLSCQLYQRSGDVFLGVPFNIASYALLTHMVAQVCELGVGDFVHTFGDVHLYRNHLNQAVTQIAREPKPLPRLELNSDIRTIDDFTFDDINLVGYDPYPLIKAEVSV